MKSSIPKIDMSQEEMLQERNRASAHFAEPDKVTPFGATTASVLIDAVRGITALLVCIHHVRHLLFVDFSQLKSRPLALDCFYLSASGGHYAVLVFFVLSGYLVGGSVLRANSRDAWNWPDYAMRRIVRLWIVLLPALAAGALWDFAGTHLHLAPGLYAGLGPNLIVVQSLRETLTLPVFLGNIAFLQGILVPTFGSDGPLWSLSYEFWYYVLFPLVVLALRRPTQPWRRIMSAASAVAVVLFVGKNIMMPFPCWLSGALLYFLPRVTVRGSLRWLAACAYSLFFFAMCTVRQGRIQLTMGIGPAGDVVFAIATAGFLWILLGASEPAGPSRPVAITRTTAKFSYSLYVVHTPFLVFMTALLAHDTRWQPDLPHMAVALALLATAISYAWLFALCTEFHTDAVRKWIAARLFGSGSPKQPSA